MTLLFSTFDPAALGPLLALEDGNTILFTTSTADESRMARCLYGKSDNQWFAEFAFWGDDDIDDGYVGIAKSTASLSNFVGGDSDGYSYQPLDGSVWNNNAKLTTAATAEKGDIIGVWVQIGDGTSPSVSWFKNGVLLYSASLPDAGPWYLAATVAGPTAGGLRCWINAGQRDFEFPIPGVRGWFQYPEALPAVLLASDDYISPATDSVPNVIWDGRISDDSLSIVSELKFWVDGRSNRSTRGSAASLDVANGDGALDWLAESDPRDLAVQIQSIENHRASYSTATSIADMTLDGVQASDPGKLRLSFVSSMQLLDQVLQTRIFPPSADPVVAGRPWPISLGAARQITPVLVDPVNRVYAVSDVGVVGWGFVRDKGAPLDPSAVPPGYVIGDDFRTIILDTDPIGKLTADVSSVGGGTLPDLSDDIWLGYGDPFTTGLASFDNILNAAYQATGKAVFTSPGPSGFAWIGLTTATCLEGRSYRYRVVIDNMPGPNAFGTPAMAIVTALSVPVAAFTQAGTYEGTFTAGGDFVPRLRFSEALNGSTAVVSQAYILEIPDTYTPADINAIPLADFLREIIEVRAHKDQSFYSITDAQAIDTDTGYSGSGYFESGASTVRNAIEAILPGYTACAWVDSDNVIRFTRLTDPEDETSVGDITEDDLLSELSVKPDLAPGLSTQAYYRRNWTILTPTDFVSDYLTVPGSTRRALSQQYQGVVASAIALGPAYAHAVYAEPIGFLLDAEADAQAEIDRIVAYYAARDRKFYETEVSAELGVTLGSIWTLTHSRYGLESGKQLLVCKVTSRPLSETVKITLRG